MVRNVKLANAGPSASPKYMEACNWEKTFPLFSQGVTSAAYDWINARVVKKAPVKPPMTNSSRIQWTGNLSGNHAATTETASPENIPRALKAIKGLRPYRSDHFPNRGLLMAQRTPDSKLPYPRRRPISAWTAASLQMSSRLIVLRFPTTSFGLCLMHSRARITLILGTATAPTARQ